jgi:hypothetical protein
MQASGADEQGGSDAALFFSGLKGQPITVSESHTFPPLLFTKGSFR